MALAAYYPYRSEQAKDEYLAFYDRIALTAAGRKKGWPPSSPTAHRGAAAPTHIHCGPRRSDFPRIG